MKLCLENINNIFETNMILEVYGSSIIKDIMNLALSNRGSSVKRYQFKDVNYSYKVPGEKDRQKKSDYYIHANSEKDLKKELQKIAISNATGYRDEFSKAKQRKIADSLKFSYSKKMTNSEYQSAKSKHVFAEIDKEIGSRFDLAAITDDMIKVMKPKKAHGKKRDGVIFWVNKAEGRLQGVSYDGRLLYKRRDRDRYGDGYDDYDFNRDKRAMTGELGYVGMGFDDIRSVERARDTSDIAYFVSEDDLKNMTMGYSRKKKTRADYREGALAYRKLEDIAKYNKERYAEMVQKRKANSVDVNKYVEEITAILAKEAQDIYSSNIKATTYDDLEDRTSNLRSHSLNFWGIIDDINKGEKRVENLTKLREIADDIKRKYGKR